MDHKHNDNDNASTKTTLPTYLLTYKNQTSGDIVIITENFASNRNIIAGAYLLTKMRETNERKIWVYGLWVRNALNIGRNISGF